MPQFGKRRAGLLVALSYLGHVPLPPLVTHVELTILKIPPPGEIPIGGEIETGSVARSLRAGVFWFSSKREGRGQRFRQSKRPQGHLFGSRAEREGSIARRGRKEVMKVRDRYSRERRRAIEAIDTVAARMPSGPARERLQGACRVLRSRMALNKPEEVRRLIQVVTDVSETATELIRNFADHEKS